MTLYYEDDPADDSTPPQLPPLLRAVAVPDGQDVLSKAVALAANSEVGTVFLLGKYRTNGNCRPPGP